MEENTEAEWTVGQEGRKECLLNQDWLYCPVPDPADFTDMERWKYDDHGWQRVNLPHDAFLATPFSPEVHQHTGFFTGTNGCYRKRFLTPEWLEGRRLFVQFEGVYMASDVWINEHHLGRFYNGYLDFEYDLTPYLNAPGRQNLLTVSFLNQFRSSRWYTGGGIYRNVHLLAVDPLHVKRFGTFFCTPQSIRQVEGRVEVVNQTDRPAACQAETVLYDPYGELAAVSQTDCVIPPGETAEISQSFFLEHPVLWDIDAPYRYRAVTRIRRDGHIVDCYDTLFGIRTVEIDAQNGLTLNGRKVFVKGVCLHHDLGALGSAALERGIEKRLETLKKMGVNSIRLSHNPYSSSMLDLCDQLGLLVFDEAYDKWDAHNQYYQPDGKFADHWQEDMTTFIQRDRNHPSVYLWSVGNEEIGQIYATDGVYDTKPLEEKIQWVHSLDSTRKVTCALYPIRSEAAGTWTYIKETHPWAEKMDVASWNYMQPYFEKDHETYPDMPLLASEVSVDYKALGYDQFDHRYTVGMYFWGGIEYFGESTGYPYKGWTNGYLDIMGYPKGIGAAMEAAYTERPFLKLGVLTSSRKLLWNGVEHSMTSVDHHWNWETGSTVHVVVYSNCEEVALYWDGAFYQNASPHNRLLELELPYHPGSLRAIGFSNGMAICQDTLETAGEAVRLRLEADYSVLRADGSDLCYCLLTACDSQGRTVPVSDIPVTFSVTGAGSLAGVANGDLASEESYLGPTRSLSQGQVQAVVRSSQEEGGILVSASAPGFPAVSVSLSCVKRPVKIKKTGYGDGVISDNSGILLAQGMASGQFRNVSGLHVQPDPDSEVGGYCHQGTWSLTLPETIQDDITVLFLKSKPLAQKKGEMQR